MTIVMILLAVNTGLILFLAARALSQNLERTERMLRDEIRESRRESGETLKGFGDSLNQGLDRVRESVEKRLSLIQRDNNDKLEQMRATVDEKLHATLEKRLGESFKLVDEQLSKVHKDLGEMRNLAVGVGDLKKVLTNVKTRGTWGEVQLGRLLEQALTPEQYETNVVTKHGGRDPVEFAIVFPGKDGEAVRLPVDAKFPLEDYQRLQEARENGDKELADEAFRALEQRIKLEARKIREKYIDPPYTTDFAVMFLPVEGLYADVLACPGLSDLLQREYRISIAGPNTIFAFLNSLQMGFRTLAVEKRASEVWQVLGAVKTEFGKFGDILDKTQKKLREASNTIEDASKKSRTIERRLGKVQELPSVQSQIVLENGPDGAESES